jgi:hypothetical protein
MFWAKKILGWNNNYTISPLEEDLEIKEYKGSIEFMYVLDKYFEAFEDTLLSGIPYSHKERIINRYQELKSEFPNIDMPERLDLAVNYAFAQKQFENARIGK